MSFPNDAYPPAQPPGSPSGAGGSRGSIGGLVVRMVLSLVLGVVVAVLGTVVHRYGDDSWYAGIVLALALTASGAVLCRAWSGLGALLVFGGGWIVAAQALSVTGSGGDVLVVQGVLGLVWSYGGLAVIALAAFAPGSWFSEAPVRRRSLTS
ncbi:hypothetical protein [Antribacter gilvus]|uniref:hypothetical protein n=1 Tax=Antribacter gilvus TaxID=2304675 RepID=UPI001F0B86B1|nr:hypothetical protein [Antribacter gilvus]